MKHRLSEVGQPTSDMDHITGIVINIPVLTVTETCECGTFSISGRPETLLSVVNCDIIVIVAVETWKVSGNSTLCAFPPELLFGSCISCYITDGEIMCKNSQLTFRNPRRSTPCNPMIDYNVVREGNGSREHGAERAVEEEQLCSDARPKEDDQILTTDELGRRE